MSSILGPYADTSDPGFVEAYRSAAQDFPRPVAVLGCRRGSASHAITVDSFIDVSYDPPTMAVSVYSGSRMAESLEDAVACTLSVLTAEQKDIAQWLGEPAQPLYGVLDGVRTVEAPSGGPIIEECAVWYDLTVIDRLTVATHDLIVGEVTALQANTAAPPPLVHWAGAYHRPAPR